MRLSFILLFTMLFISIDTFSQCEGRYETPIFENIKVDTITYSDVTGFKMDVYTATDDDYIGLKPLIILAHGGAFYAGSTETPTMQRLCNEFAKRGYVAASIQYTLTDLSNLLDSLSMTETVMQAIGDGKAAIRWFRKDAAENGNQFNIDSDQIFAGGNSAGAVLMNNLAYMDEDDVLPAYMDSIILANGGLEGTAGNFGYSSEINGVLNLAGAIYRRSIISNNTAPPLFSIHGDADDVVPFDCNNVFWGDFGDMLIEMCGSSVINDEANIIGLPNELVALEGYKHTPWETNLEIMSTLVESLSNFVYNLVDCDLTDITEHSIVYNLKAYPNPTKGHINIDFQEFGTLFELVLIDLSGKIVFEDVSNGSFYSLNRNNFESGVYIMTAKSGQYTLKTKIIFN